MTISCLMVHWLERLVDSKILPTGASLLEFGPQDIATPRAVVETVARRLLPRDDADRRIAAIFEGAEARRSSQRDFYGVFGIARYAALDPFDDRADYRYDLGRFVPMFGRYDVITNFGTAEHVFDIANVFRTAHRLLRPGGILLNVLPAQGEVDHGFYNVHPVLFHMMAVHAGYEICDFQYIDDIAWRTECQNRTPTDRFDFDGLPLHPAAVTDHDGFRRQAFDRLVRNVSARSTDAEAAAPPVFDYCFVALRKRAGGRFRPPYQYTERAPVPWANLETLAATMARRVWRRLRPLARILWRAGRRIVRGWR